MEILLSSLFHAITQTHVFHLQTTSYAEHKALNKFYDALPDLLDALAESYQGKYGIIEYKNIASIAQWKNTDDTIAYLQKILKIVDAKGSSLQDEYLKNQVQEIQQLFHSTLYKLKYLK